MLHNSLIASLGTACYISQSCFYVMLWIYFVKSGENTLPR